MWPSARATVPAAARKVGRREVMVVREGARNAMLTHHDHGNAVRQRPEFVVVRAMQPHASFKQSWIGGNDLPCGIRANNVNSRMHFCSIVRLRKGVDKLPE